MTEFGKQYYRAWNRGRMVVLALALLSGFVLLGIAPIPLLPWLIALIALDLVASLALLPLLRRFDPVRVLTLSFIVDIATSALTIHMLGGMQSGYLAIYIIIALNTILLLGRVAFVRITALISLLFLIHLGMAIFGLDNDPRAIPFAIQSTAQILIFGALIYVAFFTASMSTILLSRSRDAQQTAETERALAEHEQQRWALINNVALRVQESTTPQQVYSSIAEELERVNLHCAILEWAEPGVSFRVAHVSFSNRLVEFAQAQANLDIRQVRLFVHEKVELARAVTTRFPIFVMDILESSARLLPNIPRPVLQFLVTQAEAHSMLYVPMLTQDNVSGMLLIWGKELDDNDRAPLAALAQQAASALDKARLLTEQRKRAAQLELVTNIAAQVSTAENAEQIIQPLVRQVGERFGYDVVSVLLLDAASNELHVAAAFNTLAELDAKMIRQSVERGIVGYVTQTGQTYLAYDTRTDPHYYSPYPARDPICSELAIPLRAQGNIIGVLDLESTQPNTFDATDIDALTLLANQVSAALTKTRVLALEQKRAAQLALVSEIAARAAIFSDPDTIVRTMVQLVQERFGYHHVCVSLYDPSRNEMEQRFAAGPNSALYPLGNRWNAERGLIGLAALTRQTIYSGDLNNDPRYSADPDRVANSALCVPLVSGRNVIGVLDVESEARDAFDVNDIGAMETLANQMAAALEKARSLQAERRRAAQMALVNRIASRTARLMPAEQLMREAGEMIRTQFGYYNVAVLVREEDKPGVQLVANVGGLTPFLAFPVSLADGIIGYVNATGNTYYCPNTRRDLRYVSPFPKNQTDPVRSELAIPLRRGETVIGVLDIQSEQSEGFTPNDITALEALADQLAAALENARLFESEKARAAQLDAIRVLSLKVTAERDLDAVLHSIVSSAVDLIQADSCTLDIVDETRRELVVRISFNLARDYAGYRLRFGEGLAGRVAQTGIPMIVADYTTWEGRLASQDSSNFAGVLSVPLKWQERVLGVITLHRHRDRPMFNQEELRLTSLFAAQAAVAMENADLVGALQTRLHAQKTLSEISATLLETTEPQMILDQAAAAAVRALTCETAIVFLPNPDGQLVSHANFGSVPGVFKDQPFAPSMESTPGAAFLTKYPVHWSEAEPATLRFVNPLMPQLGYRAGISMPMLVGEQVVGVISISTRNERNFDTTDIQTLSLLANQTASALERARYFQQVQRRVRELDLLFEGFRATASTLDPEQVIARLLEQLVRALDATSAYFVRADSVRHELEQTHEYFSEHAHALERAAVKKRWSIEVMPEVREVLAHQVSLTHIADPTLSEQTREHMQQQRVHTILRVSLAAANQLLGYVSLWETRAPRAWTPDDVRFVQTMASQAAVALINAQLYQAAQTSTRELQALHEASRSINSTFDLRAICESSVNALGDMLGYQQVGIYFLEGDHLELQVQRGYPVPVTRLSLRRRIAARAVMQRETIFLPDVKSDPEFIAALDDVQSEIAVPLIAGERVIGVLNVETTRSADETANKRVLSPSDVQLLTTFANQIVIAMENARLFQETQQALAQVRTLHAASQAVNADLKLEAVLAQVADQFIAALNVDSCTISETDLEHREMITLLDRDPLLAVHTPSGMRFPMSSFEEAMTMYGMGHAQAFREDQSDLEPDVATWLHQYQWRAYVFVPLIAKGEIIGCVELGERKRPRTFDADELQLAESLANQAALALQNARLFRDAERRLQETEALYRFARELGGTLDTHQLGTRALEAAARLTDFDIGEVSLVREGDSALVPFVITGTDYPLSELVIPRGEGVSGWVVEHGRSVRLGDVTRDPRYHSTSPHMMSELCLPLRVGAHVIGVLNLEAKAPNAFDAHTEELMVVFANQLAIAIENARLYEQTKRDAEVKAALLRELSHRVKNNLAAITSLLYLALDEPPDTREQILSETLGRVQSMALAHALLARSGDARVSLVDLGRQVLNDTVRNLARPGAPIQVIVDGDLVQVGARQTTTLALVLNELATNSLRHGFENTGAGELPILRFTVVGLAREIECYMEDNGSGLPGEFAVDTNAGLGLNLVRTLVEKDLHGRFHLERRAAWTRAEIRFQLAEM
mgnify:CR=1 FL=1